jgi:hypothetical protein
METVPEQEGHFLRTAAGCAFTGDGRKAFFSVYGRRMADEVTQRRLCELQNPMLSKDLIDLLEPLEHDGREEQVSPITVIADVSKILRDSEVSQEK